MRVIPPFGRYLVRATGKLRRKKLLARGDLGIHHERAKEGLGTLLGGS